VTNTTLSLDSYQDDDIDKLVSYGKQIVTRNKNQIDTLVETLVKESVDEGRIKNKCFKA
jgi:hypothetical protein